MTYQTVMTLRFADFDRGDFPVWNLRAGAAS